VIYRQTGLFVGLLTHGSYFASQPGYKNENVRYFIFVLTVSIAGEGKDCQRMENGIRRKIIL
jgi:hypothetical protein